MGSLLDILFFVFLAFAWGWLVILLGPDAPESARPNRVPRI
jgi:hypothetical protein